MSRRYFADEEWMFARLREIAADERWRRDCARMRLDDAGFPELEPGDRPEVRDRNAQRIRAWMRGRGR